MAFKNFVFRRNWIGSKVVAVEYENSPHFGTKRPK